MSVQNIANVNSPTVPLAVTTTSASVNLPNKGPLVLVSNIGASPAWLASGTTAATAVASTGNGLCVPNGQTFYMRLNPTDGVLAAVTATGTTTLSISCVSGGVIS